MSAAFALNYAALAQIAAADSGAPTNSTTTKTTTSTATTTTSVTTWGGLSWGIGLAADFDLGGTRVNGASVVNNIVRVTDSSTNVGVGFVLEAHYFFRAREFGGGTTCSSTDPIYQLNCNEVATGPFVAIEVGGGTTSTPAANGPITAYALGWMIGLRHPSVSVSPTSSWNFGVGLRIDPKSQVLGDGIVANQPLPAGESTSQPSPPFPVQRHRYSYSNFKQPNRHHRSWPGQARPRKRARRRSPGQVYSPGTSPTGALDIADTS
jgi:hypothetical protein